LVIAQDKSYKDTNNSWGNAAFVTNSSGTFLFEENTQLLSGYDANWQWYKT
jgi:hypothetical protein